MCWGYGAVRDESNAMVVQVRGTDSTMFPDGPGLGASFDKDLLHAVGESYQQLKRDKMIEAPGCCTLLPGCTLLRFCTLLNALS